MKKQCQPWHVPTACLACGDIFVPVREHQRFCSTKCRVSHWNLTNKKVEEKFRDRIADHEKRIKTIELHLDIKPKGENHDQ